MKILSAWRERLKANKYRVYAWVIGLGFVLFAVHNPNQPFINVAFIPVIGMALSMITIFVVLQERRDEVSLGDKRIWIPLVVIVAGIAASGFIQLARGEVSFNEALVPLAFGGYLFAVYLVARILKEELFAPFAFAVVIEAASCVIAGLTNSGIRTGGIVGPTNYDMASGFLIMGTLFSAIRNQWWLCAVAVIGLAFAGAEEGMIAVVILSCVVIGRRDWGKRILAPISIIVMGGIVLFGVGAGTEIFESAVSRVKEFGAFVTGGEVEHKITATPNGEVSYPREFFTVEDGFEYDIQYDFEWEEDLDNILSWRWTQVKTAAQNFSWVGHTPTVGRPINESFEEDGNKLAYNIVDYNYYTVHNVPLVIVDQIGVLPAIAWLFVTIFCLIKTKWKYAWVAVISLSLFDHFIWTQIAPWWWVLVGVSTVSDRSDLIFKRPK